jgi:hypothetical protein
MATTLKAKYCNLKTNEREYADIDLQQQHQQQQEEQQQQQRRQQQQEQQQ